MFLFRRLFWLMVGFLLGLGSSWVVMRRVRRVAERYVPSEVVDRWGGTVRAAMHEGKTAMRSREAELAVRTQRSHGADAVEPWTAQRGSRGDGRRSEGAV